jgi:hypothetical protein
MTDRLDEALQRSAEDKITRSIRRLSILLWILITLVATGVIVEGIRIGDRICRAMQNNAR